MEPQASDTLNPLVLAAVVREIRQRIVDESHVLPGVAIRTALATIAKIRALLYQRPMLKRKAGTIIRRKHEFVLWIGAHFFVQCKQRRDRPVDQVDGNRTRSSQHQVNAIAPGWIETARITHVHTMLNDEIMAPQSVSMASTRSGERGTRLRRMAGRKMLLQHSARDVTFLVNRQSCFIHLAIFQFHRFAANPAELRIARRFHCKYPLSPQDRDLERK